MTRKDYVLVAAAILRTLERSERRLNNTEQQVASDVIESLIDALAEDFARENPAFDAARFRIAAFGYDFNA